MVIPSRASIGCLLPLFCRRGWAALGVPLGRESGARIRTWIARFQRPVSCQLDHSGALHARVPSAGCRS